LGHVTQWQTGDELGWPETLCDFWFTYGDEAMNASVDSTLYAVTLYAKSDTALAYALHLQREYGDEICMFEGDNIAGAIPLSQISDAKDLRNRLQQPTKRPKP